LRRLIALTLVAVASVAPPLAAADAAGIELDNAWLRPAIKGQPSAAVYVDIRSDTALKLVGASSPIANGAELIRNTTGGDPSDDEVVRELPVAEKGETRLALYGNYIRLKSITQDAKSGEKVALNLTFSDVKGRKQTVATEALVRGLLPRIAPNAPPSIPPANVPPAEATGKGKS
jgi:copper(I)-binding protein